MRKSFTNLTKTGKSRTKMNNRVSKKVKTFSYYSYDEQESTMKKFKNRQPNYLI